MKRLLIALLFLMPLSASAEHENIDAPQVFWAHKPIQCGKPNEIIKIPEQYGEKPMVTGTGLAVQPNGPGFQVQMILGVNPKTGTWTLIEMTAEQACVLGAGKEITLIKPDTTTKLRTDYGS